MARRPRRCLSAPTLSWSAPQGCRPADTTDVRPKASAPALGYRPIFVPLAALCSKLALRLFSDLVGAAAGPASVAPSGSLTLRQGGMPGPSRLGRWPEPAAPGLQIRQQPDARPAALV